MNYYLESLALVERLHRLLLDVIKDKFERVCMTDKKSGAGVAGVQHWRQ
jgi:hypothetical protein